MLATSRNQITNVISKAAQSGKTEASLIAVKIPLAAPTIAKITPWAPIDCSGLLDSVDGGSPLIALV
jgi:hypothetical protein